MSKNNVNWHPCSQGEPPKAGRYLVTIADYENYVGIRKYSKKNKWKNCGVIAWVELPSPFGSRRKNILEEDWCPYPDKKPIAYGPYFSTMVTKKKKSITSISLWFPTANKFFDEDVRPIVAWAELPEPYEEENYDQDRAD